MQILVVVANIQAKPSKAEVEKGSTRTSIDRGVAAPEGGGEVPRHSGDGERDSVRARASLADRKGIGHRFPSLDTEICLRAVRAVRGLAATQTPPETMTQEPGKSSLFLVRSPEVRRPRNRVERRSGGRRGRKATSVLGVVRCLRAVP